MGLLDQLPGDLLLLILECSPTKQAFGSLRSTFVGIYELSAPLKTLLVTKRKLVWRDKIARNEAVPVSYTHLTLPTKRIV